MVLSNVDESLSNIEEPKMFTVQCVNIKLLWPRLTLEENFRGRNAMMWVLRDTCRASEDKLV